MTQKRFCTISPLLWALRVQGFLEVPFNAIDLREQKLLKEVKNEVSPIKDLKNIRTLLKDL